MGERIFLFFSSTFRVLVRVLDAAQGRRSVRVLVSRVGIDLVGGAELPPPADFMTTRPPRANKFRPVRPGRYGHNRISHRPVSGAYSRTIRGRGRGLCHFGRVWPTAVSIPITGISSFPCLGQLRTPFFNVLLPQISPPFPG